MPPQVFDKLSIMGVTFGKFSGMDIFRFYNVELTIPWSKIFGGEKFDWLSVDYEKGLFTVGSNERGGLASQKVCTLELTSYDK